MNFKFTITAVVLWVSIQLSAQELSLALSQHPNKQAVIVAVHGVRKDTLGTVQLDQKGKGVFNFKNNQAQAGLVNLTIKDKAHLSYDFVLSPIESPTLICDMEYVYAQNTTMLNSPENDGLNRWFDKLVAYKQKITTIDELSQLYQPTMAFSKLLATEKQTVENQLQMLTDTINQSTLFAGKYMQFKLAQEEKLAKVWESEEEKTIAKNYFTQLDFDALYGSSMWFAIINLCLEAYEKESPYHHLFGEDVVENLKRIKNQQVYEDLIDAAIAITQKFGWNKEEEAIVKFIVKDKRIKNPQGKLEKIMQSNAVVIGKKGPNLVLTNTTENKSTTTVLKTNQLNAKYSLLLFYQTGCGYCETLLTGLKSQYPALIKKGVKTISIAGDTDQAVFAKSSSDFPWQNKYREPEGMNGINFKNYGVIGTPTLFLVNSKGIIIEKMATLEQLMAWMEKSGEQQNSSSNDVQ